MSRAEYDRVINDLEEAGCGEPEGRTFHAAYGDDRVQMFEVWHSREQFENHQERLFATLQAAGVDCGIVEVHSMHSDLPD
jgi:quinol monooxygenase YgiN